MVQVHETKRSCKKRKICGQIYQAEKDVRRTLSEAIGDGVCGSGALGTLAVHPKQQGKAGDTPHPSLTRSFTLKVAGDLTARHRWCEHKAKRRCEPDAAWDSVAL